MATREGRSRWLLLLAGIALSLPVASGCRERAPAPRPSLLLVTIDTLRADHLGVYGYPRATSPRIDRFAAGALVFDRAFAPMATTLPAHASLLTGTHPLRHGVVSNFRFFGRPVETGPGLRSAAAMLQDAGYATAAFTSAAPLAAETGIAAGFAHFRGTRAYTAEDREHIELPGEESVGAALEWLERAPRPFFLWVHLFDPHHPYRPRPPFDRAFRPDEPLRRLLRSRGFPEADLEPAARLVSAYDGEVAYTDAQVGRLLDALRRLGHWDRTVVVLTADHGEGLGQHGQQGHGLTWNEQLRVPLILRIPGGPRGRQGGVASLIDVLPTLAAHTELPLDATQFDGRDLLGPEQAPVLSQRVVRRKWPDPVFTLTTSRWKYWHDEGGSERLYDLASDPHELRDLLAEEPQRAEPVRRELRRELAARRAALAERAAPPAPQVLPAPLREQLEALGYTE